MLRSMTGFGRAEGLFSQCRCVCEISSVNRKQFDLRLGLPKEAFSLQEQIRKKVAQCVERGAISVDIRLTNASLEKKIVKEKVEAWRALAQECGLCVSDDTFFRLLVTEKESQEEGLRPEILELIEKTLHMALDDFVKSKEREGFFLQNDMQGRIKTLKGLVAKVEVELLGLGLRCKERLLENLKQFGPIEWNEGRLEQELVIYAEKSDVSEECVRLKAHLDAFLALFEEKGIVGRKGDFLVQELLREANTMSSKLSNAKGSGLAAFFIEMKGEIERIREQVQNIE